MPVLEGVKIGPLDPDSGAEFGSIAAGNAARQLLRAHVGMYSRDLTRALSLGHHEERSRTLVLSEVEAAVKSLLPKGGKVTGASIHGEDDGPAQFLTFTYSSPRKNPTGGPDGLVTGKGAVDYDPEAMPESHAAGDRAVGIRRAREDGLPWHPESGVLDPPKAVERERALAAARAAEDDDTDDERDESEELKAAKAEAEEQRKAREAVETERDDLRTQLAELSTRLTAVENSGTVEGVAPDDRGDLSGPAGTAEGEDSPPEPWEGYEGTNAAEVVKRLRETRDADEAKLVVAFEEKNGRRGTVLAAANGILDGH